VLDPLTYSWLGSFVLNGGHQVFKVIKYEDLDNGKVKGNYILIDVRSPKEYNAETIPGAINIPIFNDTERELIGTTYVQKDPELAKKIGLEAAAARLPAIYEQIAVLDKKYDKLILFCARGGFRSSSLVSLFMTIGVNIFKLDKGYKGYRTFINENLPKVIEGVRFVVLYGNTGTGKTHILEYLKDSGRDILDLEGSANHRGSTLGAVGLGKQNSQKMFESLIYDSLRNRKSDTVFVEGESRKIGKVIIPDYIYSKMSEGLNICINADIENRIDNVLKDYVHGTDEELKSSLNFLRSQLGHATIDRYIKMIDKKEYRQVIKELMIKYYDPHYEYKNRQYVEIFENVESSKTAKEIILWIEKC
jgi:tRNA 2-selenouridine synthase